MTNNEHASTNNAADDRPRAWRPADLTFARISERTRGDWLRWMVADGVLRRIRGIKVGRPSRGYAWIAPLGDLAERRGVTPPGLMFRVREPGPDHRAVPQIDHRPKTSEPGAMKNAPRAEIDRVEPSSEGHRMKTRKALLFTIEFFRSVIPAIAGLCLGPELAAPVMTLAMVALDHVKAKLGDEEGGARENWGRAPVLHRGA